MHVGVRAVSTAQPTVQQLCEEGLGIARLSYIEAFNALQRHELVPLLPKWTLRTFPVTLVTPRKDGQPAKVRAAIDALRTYFQDLPTSRSVQS
ncbi:MAG: LysR substrate-binding domain-containing protein [Rhodanobacter sp.]